MNAHYTRRLLAFSIDNVIFLILSLISIYFFENFIDKKFILLIMDIFFILYFIVMEASSYQATIGKLFLNIYVCDKSGDKISYKQALIRNTVRYFFCFLYNIGYLTYFITKNKQGVHDILGKTYVKKIE